MEPLAHGAIGRGHRGDLREHRALGLLCGLPDGLLRSRARSFIAFFSAMTTPHRSELLAARSPGLRLDLSLEIERHCSANEILQGRLIDLVAFVDVDGAPDIPVEAGVEET